MEFLEDLFDFGDRKRKKHGESFRQGNRDDHHDDHDGDEHCHDSHHNHPINAPQVYSTNPPIPQTGLFCTRCSTQLFANRWLNTAILWEVALLLTIIYVPFLHNAFGTYYLPLVDWLIIGGLAMTIVPVLELAKWMERKGWFGIVEQVLTSKPVTNLRRFCLIHRRMH